MPIVDDFDAIATRMAELKQSEPRKPFLEQAHRAADPPVIPFDEAMHIAAPFDLLRGNPNLSASELHSFVHKRS